MSHAVVAGHLSQPMPGGVAEWPSAIFKGQIYRWDCAILDAVPALRQLQSAGKAGVATTDLDRVDLALRSVLGWSLDDRRLTDIDRAFLARLAQAALDAIQPQQPPYFWLGANA